MEAMESWIWKVMKGSYKNQAGENTTARYRKTKAKQDWTYPE